jgi:hypothetical protein
MKNKNVARILPALALFLSMAIVGCDTGNNPGTGGGTGGNWTPPSPAEQLSSGQWIDGHIPFADDTRWYKFIAAETATHYVFFSPNEGENGNYDIELYDSSGAPLNQVTSNAGTERLSHPITAGVYYVKVYNKGGGSNYHMSYSTAILPFEPHGVKAEALSGDSISVSWNAVSDAVSYDLYYAVEGSFDTKTLIGTVTGTSYTHTGLVTHQLYYYFVKAVNSAGESGYGNPSGIMTLYDGPPSAPTGVSAYDVVGNSLIRVQWDSAPYATSYNVYCAAGSSDAQKTKIASNIKYPGYADRRTFSYDQTYYYFITAVNSAGESGFSSFSSRKVYRH